MTHHHATGTTQQTKIEMFLSSQRRIFERREDGSSFQRAEDERGVESLTLPQRSVLLTPDERDDHPNLTQNPHPPYRNPTQILTFSAYNTN